MKFVFISLVFSFNTYAYLINVEGTFISTHKVPMSAYLEPQCLQDKGTWEKGICFMELDDCVSVEKKDGSYELSVDSVGPDADMCKFKSHGKIIKNKLVASLPNSEIIRDPLTGDFQTRTVLCEVTLSYNDANTVSITNNGNCKNFCASRAQLVVTDARREAE
jgi:hypothetical protein